MVAFADADINYSTFETAHFLHRFYCLQRPSYSSRWHCCSIETRDSSMRLMGKILKCRLSSNVYGFASTDLLLTKDKRTHWLYMFVRPFTEIYTVILKYLILLTLNPAFLYFFLQKGRWTLSLLLFVSSRLGVKRLNTSVQISITHNWWYDRSENIFLCHQWVINNEWQFASECVYECRCHPHFTRLCFSNHSLCWNIDTGFLSIEFSTLAALHHWICLLICLIRCVCVRIYVHVMHTHMYSCSVTVFFNPFVVNYSNPFTNWDSIPIECFRYQCWWFEGYIGVNKMGSLDPN